MPIFILPLFILWALLDLYSFNTIATVSDSIANQTLQQTIGFGFWLTDLVIAAGLMLSLRKRDENGISHGAYRWIALFFLFFVPKIVMSMVLLGEDLFRLTEGLVALARYGEWMNHGRSVYAGIAGLVLAFIPFAGIAHGVVKGKYRYTIHEHHLAYDDLPEEFDGYTIAHISDIHSGSFREEKNVLKGVEMVNGLQPDLILFTGDLVNGHYAEALPWIPVFQKLQAKDGVYSVLGNHDYPNVYSRAGLHESEKMQLARLAEIQHQMGFRLLLNESNAISRNGKSIFLAGVENWGEPPFPQYGNIDQALLDIPKDAFTILLSHDPSHWNHVVKKHERHIHLTLSGHTHGMQFGIDIGFLRWSPVQYKYKQWAGLYKAGNRILNVNRGFGFIGFPGRVGIFPEITKLVLHKK